MKTNTVRREIEGHVEYWQKKLQLDHYKLEIKWKSLEDAVAETLPEGVYDDATITFDDERLLKRDSAYIERTVIHELLHLLDRDRDKIFEQIEGSLAPDTYRLFKDTMEQMTEVIIDKLATILYELDQENEGFHDISRPFPTDDTKPATIKK